MEIDLPLEREKGASLLAGVIGLMSYLCIIAILVAILSSKLLKQYDKGLEGRWTIEFTTPPKSQENKIQEVLEVIHNTPKVEKAVLLDKQKIYDLLSPWIGSSEVVQDLPIPVLVDVQANFNKAEVESIKNNLSILVENVNIQDNSEWYLPFLRLMNMLKFISITVSVLITLATAVTAMLTTTMNLNIHKDVIEILQLIGAKDNYIARQFQWRSFLVSFKALILSVLPAAATLFIIEKISIGFQLNISINYLLMWPIIFIVPIFMSLLIIITTRHTVMRYMKS